MALLTVGSIGLDEISTPTQESGLVVGGSVNYIAWSASNFAPTIHVVSVAGEDFPQAEFDALKNKNVNLDGVQIIKGGKTFHWKGKYHQDMNNRDTLLTELNVLQDFNPILPNHYKKTDILLLGNLHPQVQISVLNQLENKPLLVGLDTMNFWMDVALEDLKNVIRRVDILFLNDSEALQLSKQSNLRKAIHTLQQMGPQYLCIKKGEHGVILVAKDQIFICPALLIGEVVDPTGAGDSFAGGMMGYLALHKKIDFATLQQSIIAGTVMASFCVEDFSTHALKKLTKEAIAKRTQELLSYITIH